MPFGLFGKLPQKRDFLSVNIPTAILNPFETWLQSAVAASRSEIGRNWDNYYLVAPIWRFWLGKDILGTAITGALMPSVDQVGRYFPLSIIYYAGPGETLAPPLVDPIDGWYGAIEARLLSVLAENAQADPGVLLGGLRPPDYSHPPDYSLPVAAPPPQPQPAPPVEAPAPAAAPPPEPEPPAPVAAAAEPVAEDEAEVVAEVSAEVAEVGEEETVSAEPIAEPAAAEVDENASAPVDDDTWNPEPMAADRLAELDRIAAASFAPEALWGPAVPEAAPAAPAVAAPAAVPAGLWDDVPGAAPPEPPPAAPARTGNGAAPMAVLGGASANPFALDPEPAPVTKSAPEAAPVREAPVADEPTPVYDAPPQVPVEVMGGEFKGGLVATIANAESIAAALPQLMALDIAQTAQTRGYWWCGPSSSGGPRLYAKAGLPDPYFYSRMLMWAGN